MKNSRLITLLTGASVIGFAAAAGAQSVDDNGQTGLYTAASYPFSTSPAFSNNPGATGIQVLDNPLTTDAQQSIGMRQAGEAPNSQPAIARVAYTGPKGPIDLALENTAATQSIRAMLNARVAVAEIDSMRYQTRMLMEKYVVARIAATDEAIASLVQTGGERLTGETRAHAVRIMHRQEQNLEMALVRARRVNPGEWLVARSDVASDYQHFADAAGHAEDVAKGTAGIAGLETARRTLIAQR